MTKNYANYYYYYHLLQRVVRGDLQILEQPQYSNLSKKQIKRFQDKKFVNQKRYFRLRI